MKLSGRDALSYLKRPDAAHAGLLIFGADAMRVATRRQEVIRALVGPAGEEEMRLTRLSGADLRKDPALLQDGIKAQGFFPGHRVVFVEEAGDTIAKIVGAALADWQAGDAQIVMTAGSLTAKSALRKVFESHPQAISIGIYDDPPGREEIEGILAEAKLNIPSRDVMDAVTALAQSIEPGDFRQTIEKLGLYKLNDPEAVSLEDLAACAPQSAEVDIDDLLDVVTNGEADRLGPVLREMYSQGVNPVTLSIGAMRHFRRLHQVAADPGGPGAGIGRLRPPVFGPRRDKIARQAGQWGRDRLERALSALTDADLALRSGGQTAPQKAVMERTLIRLAMMARR